MESLKPARVLVVTDHADATPAVLDAMRQRGARGPCRFRIVVPNPAHAEWSLTHLEHHAKVAEAERSLAAAVPLFEGAAGYSVLAGVSIRHDPMDVIEESLLADPPDEIILALAPHPVERRLHVDLPHRVAHFGLPVTTVPRQRTAVPA